MGHRSVQTFFKISQTPVYLSQSLGDGEMVLAALANTLADPSSSFEDRVCDRVALEQETTKLPDQQRLVVQLRYFSADGECETLETVGKKLGITRQAVSQLDKKATKKLRNRLMPSD